MDFITILATVLGGAGALGIAYAVFTSAKVQSTILLYKEENTAQGKRITTLDSDVRLAEEKITALRRENDMLRDLATGKTAIETLTQKISEERKLIHDEHHSMIEVLGQIKNELVQTRRESQ